ncbi:hypothetical protein FF098_014625 [Parvularcula flava]|uniref:Uncharacterized protein n=1 Tax=Aquisalinus luteolus TaxID=1566827 RepID=A0A8J3A3T4_9PROT|nr:hypothetical protein [Aquisalinus luteolus]NHK29152.1 hypothetical protein [Aquisalinus luteolus]GGI00146.1 hypothetical protein GCM10011355_27750 [Aquisalinus luteolus]
MSEKQMNLSMWVAEEQTSLARFALMWQEENKKNPGQYPMDMPPGEWDEQFRAWAYGEAV